MPVKRKATLGAAGAIIVFFRNRMVFMVCTRIATAITAHDIGEFSEMADPPLSDAIHNAHKMPQVSIGFCT